MTAAVNAARLDVDALKRISERGDELKAGVISLLRQIGANPDSDLDGFEALLDAETAAQEHYQRNLQRQKNELKVDPSKSVSAPFNPVSFFGPGWRIDPSDNQPPTSGKFDPDNVDFQSMHRAGESLLNGEERLRRHLQAGNVVLGAEEFLWCWINKRDIPGKWKDRYNLFDGMILLDPQGKRCVPFLFWAKTWEHSPGEWRFGTARLDGDWSHGHVSVVVRPRASAHAL